MTQYLIAGLLITASFSAFQTWRHSVVSDKLAATEHQLEIKSKEIIALNNAILEERGHTLDLQFDQKTAQLNYLETKRELSRYENREPTVIAKPGLVSKKINKAFIKQQERLACITGDITACTDTQ